MRDRWVALYLVLVVTQVPIYYWLGRGPLGFDFALQRAERQLAAPSVPDLDQQKTIEAALLEGEQVLQAMDDQTSRRARIALNRGVLAWKTGKSQEAIEGFEEATAIFRHTHGADAFHTAAMALRTAELFYLQRDFFKAEEAFARNLSPVLEYLGPRHPFPVRMLFRRVSGLVNLGRKEEAAHLAQANLKFLAPVIGEQDRQFALTTGGTLDILAREGLVPRPSGVDTWVGYLLAEQDSKSASQKPGGESD